MPLVLYTGNLDGSGTDELVLEGNRVLVRGGKSLEVSDDEFARLRGRYMLEVLDEDKPEVAPSVPATPVVPAVPSVSADEAVGSAPKSDDQLPTPPAGN